VSMQYSTRSNFHMASLRLDDVDFPPYPLFFFENCAPNSHQIAACWSDRSNYSTTVSGSSCQRRSIEHKLIHKCS